MSIKPQYTYDSRGNKVGVFLSMDDWNAAYPQIDKKAIVPELEQQLIVRALADYEAAKDKLIDWEDFEKELDKDDE